MMDQTLNMAPFLNILASDRGYPTLTDWLFQAFAEVSQ